MSKVDDPVVWRLSRRAMLKLSAVTAASTLTCVSPAADRPLTPAPGDAMRSPPSAAPSQVQLRVNGKTYDVATDTRTTLLDALRNDLKLTGTKKGCDHGQCGACTVQVDGRRINACMTLAIMQTGTEITTIEGMATGGALHPLQDAFLRHDGFQCGYCTPGQICSAAAMLDEARRGMPSHVSADLNAPVTLTDNEIRERMSGNLCRCSAYPNILSAIKDVAGRPA